MIGLVLCGGKSSRMGTDKGLLQEQSNLAWAQSTADKIKLEGISTKISINEQQLPIYKSLFNTNDLIIDNSNLPLKGPLLGLLSCHLQQPNEDLLILACDLPFMNQSILKELLAAFEKNKQAEAFLFTNNSEPEPLCAIYAAKGLAIIHNLLQQNQLKKYSMKYMIGQLNAYLMPLRSDQEEFFKNINAHADLNGL